MGTGIENSAYRIAFAVFGVVLALIAWKLADGVWFVLNGNLFPTEDAPLNTIWEVHTNIDLAMTSCIAASGICLLAALPIARPLRLRFQIWLVALWILAATSTLAAVGVLFRAAFPPSLSAVGSDTSARLTVGTSARPWAVGTCLAILAFFAVAAALSETAMLKEIPRQSRD